MRADTAPPLGTVNEATTLKDLLHVLYKGKEEVKDEVDASLKEHAVNLLAKASSFCLLASTPAHLWPGQGSLKLDMTLGGKQHQQTCHGASCCECGGAELSALVGCCRC